MHISSLIPLLSLPIALAGNAIVQNNCGRTLYLWSVGSSAGDQRVLPAGQSYSEPYRVDPRTGGIAIKITSMANGLYIGGTPQLNFQYSLSGGTIWYDAADVFGNPFSKVIIKPSDGGCPTISWPSGSKRPETPPGSCGAIADVVATLC